MLGACGPAPIEAEGLCDAFLVMVVEDRPHYRMPLSKIALEAKRENCVRENSAWAQEQPVEFQIMAKCCLKHKEALGWDRCGWGKRSTKAFTKRPPPVEKPSAR